MTKYASEIRNAIIEYGQNQFNFGANKISAHEWKTAGDRLWDHIKELVARLEEKAESGDGRTMI